MNLWMNEHNSGNRSNYLYKFSYRKKNNKSIHSANQQGLNAGFEWSRVILYQDIFMNAFIE